MAKFPGKQAETAPAKLPQNWHTRGNRTNILFNCFYLCSLSVFTGNFTLRKFFFFCFVLLRLACSTVAQKSTCQKRKTNTLTRFLRALERTMRRKECLNKATRVVRAPDEVRTSSV